MTADDVQRAQDLRRVTRAGGAATVLFIVVSWLTTQVESIRSSLPFTEDPYDAVVSFALIGIAVVGGATIVRAMGQRTRPYDSSVARRIAIGATLAWSMAAVALASDVLALVLVGVDANAQGVALVLALVAITVAAVLVAGTAVWRGRAALAHDPGVSDDEPDIIDAVGAIVGSVGASKLADSFSAWVECSPLSPRRHRVLVGVLGAAVAGVAAVAWHAVREGPWASPAAAAIYGLLMAIGVGGAYLLFLVPLRIVRRPIASDRGVPGTRPVNTG